MGDRRAPRITAAVGVIVKHREGRAACMTRNISKTGMFLLTKERWDPLSPLDLEIVYNEHRFSVRARVVFATTDGVAVAFHEPTEAFTTAFEHFLDQLIERKPQDSALAQHLANELRWSNGNGTHAIHRSAVASLSLDGAAVDDHSPPPVGEEVVVLVPPRLDAGEEAVECRATVVRHTENGFAMRFVRPSRQFRAAVNQLKRAHRH